MSKLTASAGISAFLASSTKTEARSNIGFDSSPITVDNEAERKNVISYNGGAQVGATRVIQADTPNIVWHLIGENVASDDSWIGQPYTAESSGRIAFDLQVSDVSAVVPDSNVIGRVGKNLTLGDDETVGGYRIDTAVRHNEIGFTLIDPAGDAVLKAYDLTAIPQNWRFSVSALPTVAHLGTNVTSIGNGAFYASPLLSSVTFPDSLTSIGDYAFTNCSSLSSVTLPDSVTSIGSYAFYGCSSLSSSITFGDSLTTIGRQAFKYCVSLSSVAFGDSLTNIGEDAFGGCSSLTSITFPDSLTSIGDYAFNNCYSLSSITFGDNVTSIGDSAFSGCSSLTSITLPDSLTSIGNGAFGYCSSLTEANIYVTKTIIDAATNMFISSGLATVYARASDTTWTAGTGLTIGGKAGVTVIKNL